MSAREELPPKGKTWLDFANELIPILEAQHHSGDGQLAEHARHLMVVLQIALGNGNLEADIE